MTTIKIIGCDDTTYINENDWGMPFSIEELEIIGKLSDLSKKIQYYSCMPVIEISETEEADD